jgi:1,4-alpha-glucan branching enzyme
MGGNGMSRVPSQGVVIYWLVLTGSTETRLLNQFLSSDVEQSQYGSGKEYVMREKNVKYAKPQRTDAKKAEKPEMHNSTRFVCSLKPGAKEVFVVGEFNNWDPRSDRMIKKSGAFQKTMRLAPGEYQYKFLVDGEWHCDPSAPRQVPNAFGTLNSVVRVKEMSDQ